MDELNNKNLTNMNIILFDAEEWKELLPLTYTRPVSELRVGILTITEKWRLALNQEPGFLTRDYLSEKYKLKIDDDNLLINGSLLPNKEIIELLLNLKKNEALIWHHHLLAAKMDSAHISSLADRHDFDYFKEIDVSNKTVIKKINHLWNLFQMNDSEIRADFELLTKEKISVKPSNTNIIIGGEQLFIDEGAKIEAATINTKTGPVYIDKNAEIMEGSMIRGPFYLGESSSVKMGTKIYGATSIGKHCKIGGEINNVVFQNYSNKAHDGFLGNAVIGEWCNIGADTNNSNLKNNYTPVKIWNYNQNRFVSTGSQFCGLFMGDHSKTGINTMFNTGTVVGVSANIFGPGFPRTFIPSFAWGGNHGFKSFKLEKAFETAETMMKRRGLELSEIDKKILMTVYNNTIKYRIWEK